MQNLFPSLNAQLASFNGSLESLRPFFHAIHRELAHKNDAIKSSENRAKLLLEQASNGIALVNADGLITYVTPAVLKTFGYAEEELINNPDLQISHPDERVMIKDFLAGMMNKRGKTSEVVYRVKTKSGDWRWIKSQVTNLLHKKGINSLVFNYEDITEKISLEQQLVFDKRNTEALINSSSDLMWSVDSQMRLITANKAFLDRIKRDRGVDLKRGHSVLDPSWVPRSTAEKWKERYLLALQGSTFTVSDFFNVPEFYKWEETSFYPIYEKGTVEGVSCVLRDITERQLAFETIRKNEALLGAAASIGNLGSFECLGGEDGELINDSLQWSKELYRIFRIEPDGPKVTLKKFYSFIHPEDFPVLQKSIRGAMLHKSFYNAEYRITKPNGDKAWIRSKGIVIAGERIAALKLIGTAQDITREKQDEQERTKLIEDLLQKNKDFEQFTYIVSHNLRAPVANILGLANVFKMHVKDDDTEQKCADAINQAAKRLDEIIKDIHSILQVKKEFSEKKTDVDLEHLASDVKESIKAYLEKQEGTIITDFNDRPHLFTIRGYVHSIFYNLVMNSLKYRQKDIQPVINISSQALDNKIILTFSDNGLGIDLDRFKSKLFLLYQRFHENIEGKGIGLYMVKAQVEALGGSIQVSSEIGLGTEFIITLPL